MTKEFPQEPGFTASNQLSREELAAENAALKEEVAQFKDELAQFKKAKKASRKIRFWSTLLVWRILLSNNLYDKLIAWWKAYSESQTTPKTIPVEESFGVLAAVVNRYIMVGVFTLGLALLPSIASLGILFWQNQIMLEQNKRMGEQIDAARLESYLLHKDDLLDVVYPYNARSDNAVQAELARKSRSDSVFAYVKLQKLSPLEPILSMKNANLEDLNLTNIDLSHWHLSESKLNRAALTQANLSHAYLDTAYLKGADLTKANLESANLCGANLTGAKLNGAKLFRATLTPIIITNQQKDVRLHITSLQNASLERADVRNADFALHLPRGFKELDAILDGNWHLFDGDPRETTIIIGADLSNTNLNFADFTGSDLSKVKLTGAELIGTKLAKVKMKHTDIRGADLSRIESYSPSELEKALYDSTTKFPPGFHPK